MKTFKKTLLALMLALTLGLGFQSMAYAETAAAATAPATAATAATAPATKTKAQIQAEQQAAYDALIKAGDTKAAAALAETFRKADDTWDGVAGTGTTKAIATVNEKEAFNIDEITKKVGTIMSYINLVFNPLIYFFTFSIGNFLNNDYIFANKMGEMLHNIWVVMRNLVNIIFVFILLVGAFKQILGVGEKSIKDILPKFAILLIAVNFSWLAGKVILDAANVVTNVVFAIPGTVTTPEFTCDLGADGKMHGNGCMATQIISPDNTKGESLNYIDNDNSDSGIPIPAKLNSTVVKQYGDDTIFDSCPTKEAVTKANGGKAADGTAQVADPTSALYQKTIFCWQKMDLSKYEQNNASMFLMFSVAKVQDLGAASLSTTNPNLTKVTISSIFTVVIQIVYIISFFVLYVLMIARIVMLWLFMAFSPLIVLFMIGSDFGLSFGGAEEKLSIAQFINWAFAPAKVGAVLTVGFLMILAGQHLGSGNGMPIESSSGVTYISTDSLFASMDNLQQFIWLIMVTVIIWVGTWSVLSGYEAVNGMLSGLKGAFEGGAKLIGQAPLKFPFMPIAGKKRSISDLGQHGSLQTDLLNRIRGLNNMEGFSENMAKVQTNLQSDTSLKVKLIEAIKNGTGADIHKILGDAKMDPKFMTNDNVAPIFNNIKLILGTKDELNDAAYSAAETRYREEVAKTPTPSAPKP